MAGNNRQNNNRRNDAGDNYGATRSTDLRDSPMMAHLLDALEKRTDIGHYGRLVFVMVARHFMSEEEVVDLLSKQPDMVEDEARAMVLQVQQQDYNPPSRERILDWQRQQDFPICPDEDDPRGCNVYRDLQFPDAIYERIGEFWQEKAGEE